MPLPQRSTRSETLTATKHWSEQMNTHLNYLLAAQRSGELRRAAEQARLARDARVTDSSAARAATNARTIVGLRHRGAKSLRLRIRRA